MSNQASEQVQKHIIPQDKALEFMTGGRALFTIKSLESGTHFTYKINVDPKNEDELWVNVLNGPDNTNNYRGVGKIYKENGVMPAFKVTSIHVKEWPSVIAFDFVFLNLLIKYPMPKLEIWHEGRCSRCGRVLTVPTSIELGIGPECIFKTSKFKI